MKKFVVLTVASLSVVSCGNETPDSLSQLQNSPSAPQSTDILYYHEHGKTPITWTGKTHDGELVNEDANLRLPDNTLQELHAAWVDAEELVQSKFIRPIEMSEGVKVVLEEVNLRQQAVWLVSANGKIEVLPSLLAEGEGEDTQELMTSESAVGLGIGFKGEGANFRMRATFKIFSPEHGIWIKREYPVSTPISYWDLQLKSKLEANITPSLLASSLLMLQGPLAVALGSVIDRLGTVGASARFENGHNWVSEAAPRYKLQGDKKVSHLSYSIAKSVFSEICKDLGSEHCSLKNASGKTPSSISQAKLYRKMPVVGCQYRNVKRNTRGLYSLYVQAPKAKSEKTDFFPVHSPEELSASLYRQDEHSSVRWNKYGNFLTGGSLVEMEREVAPSQQTCPKDSLSSHERCLEFRLWHTGFSHFCKMVEPGEPPFMVSLENHEQIILR